ncbi:MAG: acyl-CoA/acyl-ACP dehydrogenase [Burkholderiaceae bacterium]|nr:acyl-CoA/acyl-ACP dehydrogenase [Burkholderiaceae bacterium]
MNFDFSDDLNLLRQQARKFLEAQCPTRAVRRILDREAPFDRALWQQVARMGWLGAALPEAYGGSALGHEGLCVIAEELGRALAPIPFGSSAYLAIEAILGHGSEAQKAEYLPRLAAGELIAAFAIAEGPDNPRPDAVQVQVREGRLSAAELSGEKWPVVDGSIADLAITVARDPQGAVALYLVPMAAEGVARQALDTVDPTRDQARLRFDAAPAERLGAGPCGWEAVQALLDKAAVLFAFEQLGGAQACLEMATGYARERTAFGRPIGSFQAIKHKLADVYIAIELARSNAYYGAWALQAAAPELGLAAAAARVSASEAFHLASKENIQTHGGMGFTWEMDCHLYYRRSKMLALALGSTRHWKDRLVALWAARGDAAAAEHAPAAQTAH